MSHDDRVDLLRRRRVRGESRRARAEAPRGQEDGHDAGDEDGDPASWRLVHQDDSEALLTARRLMSSLGPEEQRLAALYFIDELTQDELAAELGLSRRTIGKYLKRVTARARALLGERKQAQ